MIPQSLLSYVLAAIVCTEASASSGQVSRHLHSLHEERSAHLAARDAPTGKDTSAVPRPALGQIPYGVTITHCTVPGKIALTYDDGPNTFTNDLLDILAKNGAKATFFVVGNNGGLKLLQGASRAVVKRMYDDGHQIGSHTWTHDDLAKITAAQRKEQIIFNEIALADVLGVFPTYFRSPYTSCPGDCLADLKTMGYHVVDYDLDTLDWEGDYAKAENIFSTKIASSPTTPWIALAHDIHLETVQSLTQYMIDQAKKLQYQLVTVGECLGDPSENWYRNTVNGQGAGQKVVEPTTTSAPPTTTSTTPTPTTTSTPEPTKSTAPTTTSTTVSSVTSSSVKSTSVSSTISSTGSVQSTTSKPSTTSTGGSASQKATSSTSAPSTTTSTSAAYAAKDSASSFSLLVGSLAMLFWL